jgi:hypothetical protein
MGLLIREIEALLTPDYAAGAEEIFRRCTETDVRENESLMALSWVRQGGMNGV